MTETRRILVTGDYGYDFDVYVPTNDDNPPPGSDPASVHVSLGGAGIPWRLLKSVAASFRTARTKQRRGPSLELGFTPSPDGKLAAPTAALWLKFEFGKLGATPADERAEVWRTQRSLSLAGLANSKLRAEAPVPNAAPPSFRPDVVLVQDDANAFRSRRPAWLDAIGKRPRAVPNWIVLKTSFPVGHGPFWWALTESSAWMDRLVALVSIKHLRRYDIRVSQGISWERTALELRREVVRCPEFAGLRRAKHLIVGLHGEGALWLERDDDEDAITDKSRATLLFDPGYMESEWSREMCGREGDAYGYHATLSTSLALRLALANPEDARAAIDLGLENGLRAIRLLRAIGHGPARSGSPGLPVKTLAAVLREREPAAFGKSLEASDPKLPAADWRKLGEFGRAACPSFGAANRKPWRILEAGNGGLGTVPHYGLARRIAKFGVEALTNVPHARFGDLFTVDRDEIEALRNVQRLLHDYERATDETKPLSIAVFGAPGSGKSFGVKQVASTVIAQKRQAFREFNLSQFSDPKDLVGALHQVRDLVLEGKLPIVFWDEFDSSDFKWLQYLLAPMQDGKFQEGQITHPIGRCVFVFAGGTSYDFEHFGPSRPASKAVRALDAFHAAEAAFKLKKGPDFKSRLHGVLNVLGPNPRQQYVLDALPDEPWRDDPTDVCFPVRRAILLRSWLGLMTPKKGKDRERLDMDPGLLAALLEVGRYRHGARSMEKLVNGIKARETSGYHRSDLPSDEVLELHLDDITEFKRAMDQARAFQRHARRLAPAIHAAWFPLAKRTNQYKVGYAKLDPEIKGDNVAAALRIPDLLGLVGLELVERSDERPAVRNVGEILATHIEVLARSEHDAWMEVRLKNGWRWVARTEDDGKRKAQRAQRLHDCLVPYADLHEDDKKKDRRNVSNIPIVAALARFKIVARRPPLKRPAPHTTKQRRVRRGRTANRARGKPSRRAVDGGK